MTGPKRVQQTNVKTRWNINVCWWLGKYILYIIIIGYILDIILYLLGLWLVVLTILKNVKVNGKDYPIYDGKKTCLKPPSRQKNPAFYDLYRSTYLRTNEHPLDAPKARDGTPGLLAFTSPPRANFTKLPKGEKWWMENLGGPWRLLISWVYYIWPSRNGGFTHW